MADHSNIYMNKPQTNTESGSNRGRCCEGRWVNGWQAVSERTFRKNCEARSKNKGMASKNVSKRKPNNVWKFTRHTVRPRATGNWQVSLGHGSNQGCSDHGCCVPEKLRHDAVHFTHSPTRSETTNHPCSYPNLEWNHHPTTGISSGTACSDGDED